MEADVGDGAGDEEATLGELLEEVDALELAHEARVEADLVEAVVDLGRSLRGARAAGGVELDDDEVVGLGFGNQREEWRIGGEAAVPVGDTVDLHGVVHEGQAGRGEDGIDGDRRLAEDPGAAGLDIGGADEELGGGAAVDGVEVEHLADDAAQRVDVERVGLVGRGQPREALEPAVARGLVERPVAGHAVPGGRAQRIEGAGLADAGPEVAQEPARGLPAAGIQARHEGRGVHRPGAGAADTDDLEVLFLQQAVEHAPGEGAVGAAALQGEVDPDPGSAAHGAILRFMLRCSLAPGGADAIEAGPKTRKAASLRARPLREPGRRPVSALAGLDPVPLLSWVRTTRSGVSRRARSGRARGPARSCRRRWPTRIPRASPGSWRGSGRPRPASRWSRGRQFPRRRR